MFEGGEHSPEEASNPSIAWVEGWATAFAMFVLDDGNFNGWWNVETYPWPNGDEGEDVEGHVVAALYDLFDSNDDNDDYISLPFSIFAQTVQNHDNDDIIEFWDNFKSILTVSERHYASRVLIDNTIDVDLEPALPLSVTFYGPNSLTYKELGYFYVMSSGGAGSISYEWYSRNVGNSTWTYVGNQINYEKIMLRDNFELRVIVTKGNESVTKIHYCQYDAGSVEKMPSRPREYALAQNYPNPFNPSTTISYSLPHDSNVEFAIYNMLGRRVFSWQNHHESSGYKQVNWNGLDQSGKEVANGIYVYVLTAIPITEPTKQFSTSHKMLLVR